MQYRNDRRGNPLSLLGFGCMRWTRKGMGIDLDKAQEQVVAAIEAGVNYFDTAWLYPGSEDALGTILSRTGLRDRINIATKLPQYLVRKTADFDRYFDDELKRLQTDHVDFYLLHMLGDAKRWQRLCELGIEEWIASKKECGAIRNIGFSFHGNSDTFIELLHVREWDFCQIQYNYVDVHSQAGVEGLHEAAGMGIPVIIMEPLRGGRLVNALPPAALEVFRSSGRDWSAAEWAFRWLYDQPEVTCVLSGMNDMDMLRENIRIATEAWPGQLSDADRAVYEQAREAVVGTTKVACTGCRYCMPCPKGVDIPMTFAAYNRMYTDGKMAGRRDYLQHVWLRKEPGCAAKCVECGACAKHCPQGLDVPRLLKEADRALSPAYMRVVQHVASSFYKG